MRLSPARLRFLLSLTLASVLGSLLVSTYSGIAASTKPATSALKANLSLEQKDFPQGRLYTLLVPHNAPYKVLPAVSKKLAGIEAPFWTTARSGEKPIFAINAGFFDPNNQQTISYLFQNGVLAADPTQNTQLTQNPKLAPYLPKIFNRPEFRVYLCRAKQGAFLTRYDITPRNASVPEDCILQDSVGAGPTLLPQVNDREEGFVDYDAEGKLTRDPIGVCAKNARSVIGLTEQGDLILMMGAQNPANPKKSGFDLADMAALLKARGATKAMALDGGSSSGLVYQGKAFYGKFTSEGTPIKRPVKSVLLVSPR